jgi:hypothetical protein
MEFEDELTGLFDSATAALRPPIEEIAQQSVAQGRRLHRRRRNTRVALSACGITVIVCGTAFGVAQTASPAGRSAAVASGTDTKAPVNQTNPSAVVVAPPLTGSPVPGSASSSASPSTSASPSHSVTPSNAPPGQDATSKAPSMSTSTSGAAHGTDFDLLKSLMPAGADLQPLPYKWGGTVPGAADALYDDGHGLSVLSISRSNNPQGSVPYFDCLNWAGGTDEGTRPAGATPISCADVSLPNGDTQISLVTGVDEHGFYDYEVLLYSTDGTVVTAVSTNGVPEGANVVVTRAVPPVSMTELKLLAGNPGWQVG